MEKVLNKEYVENINGTYFDWLGFGWSIYLSWSLEYMDIFFVNKEKFCQIIVEVQI
jgi:hypothetical protein